MLPVTGTVVAQTPAPDPFPFTLPDVATVLLRAVGFVASAAVVFLVGWFLVEPAIASLVARRNRNNPTLQEAIARYTRLSVVIVAVFVGIGGAGFNRLLTNSALVIAAGTLAVGVAGQSVIGSIVSGLALVVDPEFNIGNYIRWEDGEGEVKSITLRVTRIQPPDGGLVTIPNTTLTSEAILRPFDQERSRVRERIEIAYEDDADEAVRLLKEVAENIDGILDDPAPSVGIDELGSDAVILRIHYWLDDPLGKARQTDGLRTRSAFAQAAKERLERAGIAISPASQRDLSGKIQIEDAN